MKYPEFKPYDDYEIIKKKADEYIARILYGVSVLEHHSRIGKPTVLMSGDILSVIARGSERVLYVNHKGQTVCGCNVEFVPGTEKLYIGFNLLPQEGGR